jgi:hypothetical protein
MTNICSNFIYNSSVSFDLKNALPAFQAYVDILRYMLKILSDFNKNTNKINSTRKSPKPLKAANFT